MSARKPAMTNEAMAKIASGMMTSMAIQQIASRLDPPMDSVAVGVLALLASPTAKNILASRARGALVVTFDGESVKLAFTQDEGDVASAVAIVDAAVRADRHEDPDPTP